jgi:cellulose synthase/poly-beta-1,6-N-acetylglucosamine synthase-like glycosyltransferase
MISVCIPIYNFDVSKLVKTLECQIIELSVPSEIIMIDDDSDEEYKRINRSCNHETYIELTENIGRSKIRNLFLKYAQYQYLLFIDCDSLIVSDDFLKRYVTFIKQKQDGNVICGGRVYSLDPPIRKYMLRWKYGVQRESQSVDARRKYPNRSFMSNNFLIRRQILAKFPFDERISEYGHEDTLFGYILKKNGISIIHIDNSVLNGKLEENNEYLQKINKSIKNLSRILQFVEYDEDFVNDTGLLTFYRKVKPVASLLEILFIIFKPVIVFFLKRGYVAISLFDFYKFGLFLKCRK